MVKKATNPHTGEAETTEWLAFLLEKLLILENYSYISLSDFVLSLIVGQIADMFGCIWQWQSKCHILDIYLDSLFIFGCQIWLRFWGCGFGIIWADNPLQLVALDQV